MGELKQLGRRGVARIHFQDAERASIKSQVHAKQPTQAKFPGEETSQIRKPGGQFRGNRSRSDSAAPGKRMGRMGGSGPDELLTHAVTAGRPR